MPSSPRRKGFTLIELLVVIVIIGVLIGLLVPAIMGAIQTARRSAVDAELLLIDQSLTQFKGKFGVFPPSRILLVENGDYTAANMDAQFGAGTPAANAAKALIPRSVGYLRRIWPRMQINTTTTGVTTMRQDFNGDRVIQAVPYIADGAECLVLFLGGQYKQILIDKNGVKVPAIVLTGFGTDPTNPYPYWLPAPGASDVPHSAPYFEFANDRLMDFDGDGLLEYSDSYGGSSDLHPIAYFSSYDGQGYDPDDVDYAESDGVVIPLGGFQSRNAVTGVGGVAARPDLIASSAPNPYSVSVPYDTTNQTQWIKPQTYQLISAGRDRLYGIGGQFTEGQNVTVPFDAVANQFITGQALGSDARNDERDNLTSFTAGMLDK